MIIRQCLTAAALSSLVFLAGCGGGSDAPATTTPPQPQSVDVARTAGPLDPVQDRVSESVLTPLGDAVVGTPLEGVIRCVDETVTYNVLDIADTVLVQLQATLQSGGGVPLSPDPQALAGSLTSLAANLTQLIESLAGQQGGCVGGAIALDRINPDSNPLAGTPLAPLGSALGPVLGQIVAVLNGSGSGGQDLQLSTVANLVAQLNLALQSALAQIPQDAYAAPVVGGALTTLSTALNDTSSLLSAVLAYDSAATRVQLQNILDNTLVNLLTEVLPVRAIEDQAGQPGLISDRIEDGAAQLAALLGSTVGTALGPVLDDVLAGALDPLLDPIENELLPALLGPLSDALAGGLGGGLGGGGPLAGTALAPVVNLVSGVLGTLLGSANLGGTQCPFATLPLLSALCGLTGG